MPTHFNLMKSDLGQISQTWSKGYFLHVSLVYNYLRFQFLICVTMQCLRKSALVPPKSQSVVCFYTWHKLFIQMFLLKLMILFSRRSGFICSLRKLLCGIWYKERWYDVLGIRNIGKGVEGLWWWTWFQDNCLHLLLPNVKFIIQR